MGGPVAHPVDRALMFAKKETELSSGSAIKNIRDVTVIEENYTQIV